MRHLPKLGALGTVIVLALLVYPAGAADTTVVTTTAAASPVASNGVVIPWGTWVTAVLSWIFTIVLTLAANVIRARVKDAGQQEQLDSLLKHGLDYAFGAVQGAVKGKTLTLPQAGSIITAIEQYAIDNGPAIAAKFQDTLKQKIIARVSATGSLPPESSALQLHSAIATAA